MNGTGQDDDVQPGSAHDVTVRLGADDRDVRKMPLPVRSQERRSGTDLLFPSAFSWLPVAKRHEIWANMMPLITAVGMLVKEVPTVPKYDILSIK